MSARATIAPAVWVPARIKTAVMGRLGGRATRYRRVEAVVLEGAPFAVHPSLTTPPGPYWTVTHLPTGYGAILFARSEQAARRAAVLLSRVGCDWSTWAPTSAQFRAQPERVQRRIKTICRRAVML